MALSLLGISRWVGQKQSAAGLQLKAWTLLCHGWNQSNTRGRASETRRGTRLHGEISNLQGARTTGAAKLKKLEYDVERRVIRAPVSGRIGEAQILRVGTYIRDGDVLGVLVPKSALRIVAEFPPSSALGHIRPGQPARLRLHGFPWPAHGSVAASVSAVASEIRTVVFAWN